MRIVIDGAHGSGKSTFLNGIKNETNIPCIKQMGQTIFSDLIGKSFFQGRQRKIVPPKDQKDWDKLFCLIVKSGIQQYNAGKGSNLFWYERGLHYAKVIAKMDGNAFSPNLENIMSQYTYDYAFIFEPIETCDFSRIHKAGCRSFSLDDRYECVDLTYNIYKETGSKVCKIPVFSNDYIENFYCRYNMISEFIKKNSI